ncbi:Cysteine desulfurase family protein [Sinomonas atrocyanea]|uniref:cysteine desulfurase n=1 Tax=Sinomonas atrocyanea TaxID=37927 RepID=A0A127A2W1_9MICC|nr:cysteine desulfurase family protein [Sinomonas atrocyanea]AMM33134.1 Cysteine desulfurase family protein [Sinomonas atrocyanea]GEB63947.1 cysteine desulfurase [Sinomonas atrocyanea]
MIYLDAAATTPVRREVLEAMWPFLTGDFGNASSHHDLGARAREALEAARDEVAGLLGCRAAEVTFTSGGTEADNLAVKGIALARRGADPRRSHVAVSAIEHPAVLESARALARLHGFSVDVLAVDAAGQVAPESLAAVVGPQTAVVSVMYANNELGTVQPVAELARVAHEAGVPFHTDAVQAAGWLPLDVRALGVDALSISGHKLGAPKGVGVLYAAGRLTLEPVLDGGGQERGRRSGTENVAGAVALATALRLAEAERTTAAGRLASLRDAFTARILELVPEAIVTGHPTERLPGSASFCFPRVSGESVLLELERRGVVCSSGSACAAGSSDPSHVLLAMGLDPEVALTAVRFTLPGSIDAAALEQAAAAVAEAYAAVTGIAHR